LYDRIYLSPHLDDAVLSCGGQIAHATAAGERVLVVTLFAGDEPSVLPSVFASRLHEHFDLPAGAVMASRRREDIEACRSLGAVSAHWPFHESIYRRDRTGRALYASFRSLFGRLETGEETLIRALGDRLAELAPGASVVAPLGVGLHVDHQLVRAAAEACFGTGIAYYEDYPYVDRWGALSKVLQPRRAWVPEVLRLDRTDVERKCLAIARYASQVGTLFRSRDQLERRIRRFARKRGGERRWRRRDPGPAAGAATPSDPARGDR